VVPRVLRISGFLLKRAVEQAFMKPAGDPVRLIV
jgi:hypothetical protein